MLSFLHRLLCGLLDQGRDERPSDAQEESVLTSTGLCLRVCTHVRSSTVSLHKLMFCLSMRLSLIGNIRTFVFRCKEDTDLFAHVVCVHVCMCVYTHVCMCIFLLVCMLLMCVYACEHVYICVCSCICVYSCSCVCVCTTCVCLYKSGSCHVMWNMVWEICHR